MSTAFAFTREQVEHITASLHDLGKLHREDWFAVARVLSLSANTVEKLIRGVERIGPALAFRIATALDRPVDEVVNGAGCGRCPTCDAALRGPSRGPTLRPTGEEGDAP